MKPVTQVPFFQHDLGEPELAAIREVLAGPILTTGETVAQFERRLADYLGRRHALGLTSCTGAMHISLLALGIVVALIRQEPIGHEAARFGDILSAVAAGRAAGIIDLAILWFMATPVVTVVVVAASFWRMGDRRYALLSLLVLAILGASIFLALYR